MSPDSDLILDPQFLLKVARMRMPFGKYEGTPLIDLPERYVVWMHGAGFPKGELGKMLMLVHEIKVNGLEYLFTPLREPRSESDIDDRRYRK